MTSVLDSSFFAPFDPSDNCPHCGSIQWEDRWGELVKCQKCGGPRNSGKYQFFSEEGSDTPLLKAQEESTTRAAQ